MTAASAVFGMSVVLITEFLSLTRTCQATPAWLAWLCVDSVLLATAFHLCKARGKRPRSELWTALRKVWIKSRSWAAKTGPLDAIAPVLLLLVLMLLLAQALSFPTTNWDSHAYHLPRIEHWIQQSSIEHYPTADTRQVEFGPWTAWLGMSLRLLGGNERNLNILQWVALVGCLVLTPTLVTRLVPGRKHSLDPWPTATSNAAAQFAVVYLFTIPIALTECTNPQTDVAATFWLLCLCVLLLELQQQPTNPSYVIATGLCAGLGTLTKATFYLYAGPLLLAGGFWWLRKLRNARQAAWLMVIFTSAFLALNSGHLRRNWTVFGSPLGSQWIHQVELNESPDLSAVLSNIIRNLALHTNTRIPPVTRYLNSLLVSSHDMTGRDLNDPTTTFFYCDFAFSDPHDLYLNSDKADASYHVLLAAAALLVWSICFRRRPTPWFVILSTLASALLFCVFLKWQDYHSRLHLAFLALLSPCVGWAIATTCSAPIRRGLTLLLLLAASGVVVLNTSATWWNAANWSQIWHEQHKTSSSLYCAQSLHRAAETVTASGVDEVGIKLNWNERELRIWRCLRASGFQGRISHAFVTNETVSLKTRAPEPRLLLTTLLSLGTVPKNTYPYVYSFDGYYLLSRTRLEHPTPYIINTPPPVYPLQLDFRFCSIPDSKKALAKILSRRPRLP